MIEKAVAEETREDDDFETMLEQVVARCTIAKIETQRDTGWIDDEAILKVSMPNGRETRQILVTEENVARFLASNFEDFRFLGDYQAVVDVANNTIEASISTRSGVVGVARMMSDLPGVVVQGAQAQWR